MLTTLSTMHFVYVQWLKKRSKTASWIDGIFVFTLVIFLNLLLIIGIVSPAILDYIFSLTKFNLCIGSLLLAVVIAFFVCGLLGKQQHYSQRVKHGLRTRGHRYYFYCVMIWLFGSVVIFLPIIFFV